MRINYCTSRLPSFLHHNSIPHALPGNRAAKTKRSIHFLNSIKYKFPSTHYFMYCVVPESWPVSGWVQDRRGWGETLIRLLRTGQAGVLRNCAHPLQHSITTRARISYREHVYHRTWGQAKHRLSGMTAYGYAALWLLLFFCHNI